MNQPIMRLVNIGHNVQNNTEEDGDTLSIGVGNDVIKGIAHFAGSGLVKVGLHNIDTVCNAFEQIFNGIPGMSFLGPADLGSLGLFARPILPKPYLGTAKRQGHNQMWIAG
jgi:hypothetical protein